MTAKPSSTHDRNQLGPSIEKLLHYLVSHIKTDTEITVRDDREDLYHGIFKRPTAISVSPTLYTRIDGCHGAGNCCRVPFDLVYTDFDRQRIVEWDLEKTASQLGRQSIPRFQEFRSQLMDRLIPLRVEVKTDSSQWETRLWVQRNTETFYMSGTKSCPYLFAEGDRHFCGVHPFKPLHCWYPHMVVRVMEPRVGEERPSVTIGRMQYGRNHKFGCPVLFEESRMQLGEDKMLFDVQTPDDLAHREHYLDRQFQDDIDKLEWTSKSAESMGFTSVNNFAVGIHTALQNQRNRIRLILSSGNYPQITLWEGS